MGPCSLNVLALSCDAVWSCKKSHMNEINSAAISVEPLLFPVSSFFFLILKMLCIYLSAWQSNITLQIHQCTIHFSPHSVVKQTMSNNWFIIVLHVEILKAQIVSENPLQKTNEKQTVMEAVTLWVGEFLFSLSRPSVDAEKCCLINVRMRFMCTMCFFLAGVFWESGVQARRFEAVPDAGDPRHGSVWAVEDGPVQELHAQRAGGPGGPNPGAGAALDTSLPGAEVRRWKGLMVGYKWL